MTQESSTPTDIATILKDLVGNNIVLAQLVTNLAPFSAALTKMVKTYVIDEFVKYLLGQKYVEAKQLLADNANDDELVAMAKDAFARVLAWVDQYQTDRKLLLDIALRTAIAVIVASVI